LPGFLEDMLVEEFKSVQIEFHSTPRMGAKQVDKIIAQLLFLMPRVKKNRPNVR